MGAGSATTVTAGTTLAALVSQLNTAFTSAGNSVVASAGTGANAGKLILTGPATASSNLVVSVSSLSETAPATVGRTLGAGVDFTAAGVSSLTAATAQTVLTTVTSAIADVALQRGVIGADINQLTAASNVAAAESTNLTSAQSSIDSTNYGQATSNLAKYQLLSQTGISALAQANTVQQEVLKLLQ